MTNEKKESRFYTAKATGTPDEILVDFVMSGMKQKKNFLNFFRCKIIDFVCG